MKKNSIKNFFNIVWLKIKAGFAKFLLLFGIGIKKQPLSKKVKIITSQTTLLRTLVAVFLAYIIAFLIILAVNAKGASEAFGYLVYGPLTKARYFSNVITQAIPLMFTGLALSLMLKAGQLNLGSEGSFIMGSVMAALVAVTISAPMGIHPLIAILAGGLVGALITGIPALLKMKFNISELVISLMMNYIALYLGNLLIRAFILDGEAGILTSKLFNPTALIGFFSIGIDIQYGLLFAIALVITLSVYIFKTVAGYTTTMTGLNSDFAKYSGINEKKVFLVSQLIGGAVAGVGGSIYTLSNLTRLDYMSGFNNKGFDGVIVSILARNNPLLVPFAAIFLAYIREGAEIMSRQCDISFEIMSIIQGIIIIIVTSEALFARFKTKRIIKAAQAKNLNLLGGPNNV